MANKRVRKISFLISVCIPAFAALHLLNKRLFTTWILVDIRDKHLPLAQLIPAPSKANSAASWASAFQSPEFMLGLQTAVSHILRQYDTPTDRVTQFELLGNPTQTAMNLPARSEG